MKQPWIVLIIGVLSAGLLGGCATANGIQNARESLQKAKGAGAQYAAPFEYYAAEAYLHKAGLEAEEGDCKAAGAFTKESQAYSEKALQMVGGGVK
jgi:hypothetical protein